jgi:FtsH-binding integral membrane protein
VDVRATFIKRTYLHLLGAIIGFVLLEVWLFHTGLALKIAGLFMGKWFLVLGAWMLVSWIATHFANSARSKAAQYLGLSLFVAAEAVIFAPLLLMAATIDVGIIENAAHVTLGGFAALTAIAFITRKDFSFLRGILFWGFLCGFVLIIASMFMGFQLGFFFIVAMIALAGGAILYDTSNVIHHFPEDRYVSAALQLFSSVALLFWYVIQLFLISRD